MRDLLVLLDEIQTLGHDRVVLVAVLPRLEEDLDHVLDALLDVALVEDGAEALVDEVVGLGRVLGEEGADLAREGARDLDRVGRGLLEQEEQQLEGQELVRDRLVDEVGDERAGREADGLRES